MEAFAQHSLANWQKAAGKVRQDVSVKLLWVCHLQLLACICSQSTTKDQQ